MTHGPPTETCVMKVKDYIDEKSQPYARNTLTAALTSFLMWILHFGLYCRRDKDVRRDEDLDGPRRQSIHE